MRTFHDEIESRPAICCDRLTYPKKEEREKSTHLSTTLASNTSNDRKEIAVRARQRDRRGGETRNRNDRENELGRGEGAEEHGRNR